MAYIGASYSIKWDKLDSHIPSQKNCCVGFELLVLHTK